MAEITKRRKVSVEQEEILRKLMNGACITESFFIPSIHENGETRYLKRRIFEKMVKSGRIKKYARSEGDLHHYYWITEKGRLLLETAGGQ